MDLHLQQNSWDKQKTQGINILLINIYILIYILHLNLITI